MEKRCLPRSGTFFNNWGGKQTPTWMLEISVAYGCLQHQKHHYQARSRSSSAQNTNWNTTPLESNNIKQWSFVMLRYFRCRIFTGHFNQSQLRNTIKEHVLMIPRAFTYVMARRLVAQLYLIHWQKYRVKVAIASLGRGVLLPTMIIYKCKNKSLIL